MMTQINVTPIVEKKPTVVGVMIKGFGGHQTVELRYSPDEVEENFPQDVMVCVNGNDTDVAYIKAADLTGALEMLGIK
jgi:hypothetical protein